MVYTQPESALKRADELIAIGKRQRALEILVDVIKSRRNRTWTRTHEVLMRTLLELCVELKDSTSAKDALHQYKTIAQTVSVKSLEDVITNFLTQGEQRCSQARRDAENATVDIDDLEYLQTPESLLLSAVSGESQQDRTDSDMLAPWLKFVWDSYRQCLDLLKNNNRVDKIYQDVAQMGFRFCQRYNRRSEFRKLCDTIRTHFTQSQKYSQQTYSVNFQLPETQALHLETRLTQLDTAIQMELWQEAFKAIEDIHHLTTISKKPFRPQQVAAYYSKVALVFWKAENYIFHATTLLKLYVLHKEQKKNITHAELTRLATKTLLAILSIPLPTPRTLIDEHLDVEENINEKQKRLTNLLALQQIPTRASLIRDMIKQGVLNFVHPELKDTYQWLEVEFSPLNLSSKVEEGIEFIEKLAQPEYSQYMSALRDVTVIRLLQQVSQVYQTISLKRFVSLAPAMDKHRLERIIVNAARNNDVQVRIEHKLQALTFGTDLNVSTSRSADIHAGSKPNILQKMPNEQIRNQLTTMSNALQLCMEIVNEKSYKESSDKLRRQIAQTYARDEPNQRREILKRRELIERYKEDKENENRNKVKQAEIYSKTQKSVRDEEEKRRREDELKRQMQQAAAEKAKEEQRFVMKMAIDKLRATEIGRKIIDVIGEENLSNCEPSELDELHLKHVINHSREQKEKLRAQFKKVDYFVRALHEAEVPLLQEQAEKEMKWRREILRTEYERAIEKYKSLKRMKDDKNNFLESIRGQRHEEFAQRMKEFNQRLQVAREQRLKQLREEYIEKKKQEFRRQRKLNQQQKLDEERRRKEEERLREQRQANEERNKILAEQARKQREVEEKIERQLRAGRETAEPIATANTDTRQYRPTPSNYQQDKTENRWHRNVRERGDNPPSQTNSSDSRGTQRNDEQRQSNFGDRRAEDLSNTKGSSNEPWQPRARPDQQYRDDRFNDRRGYSSQQNKPSFGSSSDRWSERNTESSNSWQTVEKRRPNPSHTNNDRPSQQRSEEPSASGRAWQPRLRVPNEQRDEPQDSVRSGASSYSNRSRADDNNDWRSREKTRIDSWRGNEEDENGSDRPRPSGDTLSNERQNNNRRSGGGFGGDRREQYRKPGGGKRE